MDRGHADQSILFHALKARNNTMDLTCRVGVLESVSGSFGSARVVLRHIHFDAQFLYSSRRSRKHNPMTIYIYCTHSTIHLYSMFVTFWTTCCSRRSLARPTSCFTTGRNTKAVGCRCLASAKSFLERCFQKAREVVKKQKFLEGFFLGPGWAFSGFSICTKVETKRSLHGQRVTSNG